MMRKYCATCYRPIIPGSNQLTTSLMGDDYHISCLNCAKCNLPLWGKPFVKKKDGKLYCEDQCEQIRSRHLSKTNQSQIFYNNEVDPNDKVYMLNQTASPPLVMPLVSPRFNMMNNLMYENPYARFQQQQQKIQNNYDNYNNYLNSYFNQMNNNGQNFLQQNFDLQNELNKAIDKNETLSKSPDKLNEFNNSSNLNFSSENKTLNNKIQPVESNVTNNLPSQSTSSIASSASSSNTKTCHKCKRSINNATKDTFTFEDKFFHKDCYKCDKCNNELYKMKKVLLGPNGSGIYCEPCYYNLYGPKCVKCNHVIMPYMLSNKYNDKLYHKVYSF